MRQTPTPFNLTADEPRTGALRRVEATLASHLLVIWRAFLRGLAAVTKIRTSNQTADEGSPKTEGEALLSLWYWLPEDRAYVALPAHLAMPRMPRHE